MARAGEADDLVRHILTRGDVAHVDVRRAAVGMVGGAGAGPAEGIEDEKAVGLVGTRNETREVAGGIGLKRVYVGLDAGDDFLLPSSTLAARDRAVGGPVMFPEEADVREGTIPGGCMAAHEFRGF